MAFYQDAPGKKKGRTDYASLGSWDEEGTHYQDGGKKSRDGKKPASARPAGAGRKYSGEKGNTGRSSRREDDAGPGRRSDAEGRFPGPKKEYGRPRRDAEPRGRRDQEPRSRDMGNRGRRDAEPRMPREAEDYRDYEFRAPLNPREESAPEADNILCGRNPIREALRSGRDIEKLLVQKGELSGSAREIVQTARSAKIMVQEVEKSRLDEIAPHHQGLIAIASAFRYAEVEDMLKHAEERGEAPFLILLDSVTDPHNLGAIIRSAECAGAHGVIVPQHRSVGLTPSAVKASAGAVEYVPVARVTNLNRTIEDLRRRGIWVYALAMDGEDFEKVDFRGGTALVIGAEGEGISRLTREKCDQSVALPMKGRLDSLNASVAAGIMMYRVLSCRRK